MNSEKAINGALEYAMGFKTGSWQSDIVHKLTFFALGRELAKPWSWLEREIAGAPSKEAFQNLVVIPSRKPGTKCFICSCSKGFYIPVSDDDIKAMDKFYSERIAQETYHLDALRAWSSGI